MRASSHRLSFAHALLGLLLLPSVIAGAAPSVMLEKRADGLRLPVLLLSAGDGSKRIFVVEQLGKVWAFSADFAQRRLFLDIGMKLARRGSEQGLLAIAFHPRFHSNGLLFLYYTAAGGNNELWQWRIDPRRQENAQLLESWLLWSIPDPASNHNGGMLAFGPDGHLYISMGDGGGAGDPWRTAQDLSSMLGKIHRIAIVEQGGYSIPADNPFIKQADAKAEIWALGLRNPWRFSFDRLDGSLYIADVGQNKREEINRQRRGEKGVNYGWSAMEGRLCYRPAQDCRRPHYRLPLLEYDHQQGCSVTGGYVYRGKALPTLQGWYLFADYCSGRVWGLPVGGKKSQQLLQMDIRPSSFGEDADGELYLLDHRGQIYQFRPRT